MVEAGTQVALEQLRTALAADRPPSPSPAGHDGGKMGKLMAKYVTLHSNPAHRELAVCRPWSYEDYLSRVATFKSSGLWFAKPQQLSPLECSRFGWSCNSAVKDSLICDCCHMEVVHDPQSDESGSQLHDSLVTGHAEDCGWRQSTQQCDASFRELPGLTSERQLGELALGRAIALADLLSSALLPPLPTVEVVVPGLSTGSATVPCHPLAVGAARLCLQGARAWLACPGNSRGSGSEAWEQVVAGACACLPGEAQAGEGTPGPPGMQALLQLALTGWQPSPDGGLLCQLCSRSLRLFPSASSTEGMCRVDCVGAHRHFCPFVFPPSQAVPWLRPPTAEPCRYTGWQICALAFSEAAAMRGSGGSAGGRGRSLAGAEAGAGGGDLSPEQSYKRIRAVLDIARTTT